MKTSCKSNLLETCLRAITELYPHDQVAPGVVVAYLKDRRCFYASFARYPGGAKEIISSATGSTLDEAVSSLTKTWYSGVRHARQMVRKAKALGKSK